MKLVTEEEMEAIANAITDVEKETDAELITVLAAKSDNYLYIPTLWAGIIALLIPLILKLTPLWLDGDDLLLLQWFSFISLALLFRIQPLMMKLVPKSVKHWRASNMARRQFLENNLHHTNKETGVMIFLSEAEHYVEIIADRGIDQFVDQKKWQEIIDKLISEIKKNQTQQGLLSCIEDCGEILKQYAPMTHAKDELPNHLVVLK